MSIVAASMRAVGHREASRAPNGRHLAYAERSLQARWTACASNADGGIDGAIKIVMWSSMGETAGCVSAKDVMTRGWRAYELALA